MVSATISLWDMVTGLAPVWLWDTRQLVTLWDRWIANRASLYVSNANPLPRPSEHDSCPEVLPTFQNTRWGPRAQIHEPVGFFHIQIVTVPKLGGDQLIGKGCDMTPMQSTSLDVTHVCLYAKP